jgi:hypothetical protein
MVLLQFLYVLGKSHQVLTMFSHVQDDNMTAYFPQSSGTKVSPGPPLDSMQREPFVSLTHAKSAE